MYKLLILINFLILRCIGMYQLQNLKDIHTLLWYHFQRRYSCIGMYQLQNLKDIHTAGAYPLRGIGCIGMYQLQNLKDIHNMEKNVVVPKIVV